MSGKSPKLIQFEHEVKYFIFKKRKNLFNQSLTWGTVISILNNHFLLNEHIIYPVKHLILNATENINLKKLTRGIHFILLPDCSV